MDRRRGAEQSRRGSHRSWHYHRGQVNQTKRLKELERENARLKRVVADQVLDMAILKEGAAGNS